MQSSRNSFRIFRRVDTLLQPTKPKLNQIDLSKSLCTAVSNPKPIPQLLKRSNDPKHPKRRSSPFDALGYELGDNTPPPLDSRVGGHRATIDSIGPSGFTINGVRVSGSVIVMPFFSTFWNVEQMQQVSPQSLALIKLIFPKPDLLILGTGKNIVVCVLAFISVIIIYFSFL